MQLTYLKGYPDRIGKRFAFCGYGVGPTSYVGGATGGDLIVLPTFDTYVDEIESSGVLSTDGTYIVFFYPSATGNRPSWKARWFAFTTAGVGAEAANTTNLSTKNLQVSGLGGVY
jgi:hypothetical protein